MCSFIWISVWGCKNEKSIETAENSAISKKMTTNKLGIRFNKDDSGSFYFLITISQKDSLNEIDSLYHGNIFLIQPKRYQ
jgi:hypothetical protein